MDFLSIIYTLFIGPLELFFEVLYAVAYRVIGNAGLAIVFLSLAMNFLVLPLYRRADAMQEEERARASKMKPMTDHIKKTFKGDERFMMLQAYNRWCGYKPTDALKGSVSLLLEIPFFIAAYHFLSNLTLLQGVQFGPISDLGAPDALFVLGDVTINILPILMTAINLVSAIVYMKGLPIQNKIQMYGIAAIFLVLLYNSPAGLVFYWTLNNIFSLVKNVFYRLKKPGFVLAILVSIAGLAGLVAIVAIHPMATMRRQVFLVAFFFLMQIPLIVSLIRRAGVRALKVEIPPASKKDTIAFILCCVFVALLTGLLVPSAIIADSPLEFVDIGDYYSPLWYIARSLLIAIGTFVIWFGIFYWLMSPIGKKCFSVVMWVVAGVAAIDYMFFGTGYGNISATLQFDVAPSAARSELIVNFTAIIAVAIVFTLAYWKKPILARIGTASMCLAIAAMSIMNVSSISSVLSSSGIEEDALQQRASIPLSTQGQNVIVLMLDRAASCYLLTIMEEKPELCESFDGFTYYPNTISYGASTNFGVPGLTGGYEYIPQAMNERSEISLKDKHNEALRVMPYLFDDAGFEVTVCDPFYAGYSEVPDLSIFDERPNINAYITQNGKYAVEGFEDVTVSGQTRSSLLRNFFCYGLFRASPVVLHKTLYNNGRYNAADTVPMMQTQDSPSKSAGIKKEFLKAYGVIDSLPEITVVSDSPNGTFLMMMNDGTHQPTLLKEPEYTLAWSIDNTTYDSNHPGRWEGESDVESNITKAMHYHVNMATLLKLGEWFDYLRENNVYDNTRIIIVSDHAYRLGQNASLVVDAPEPQVKNLKKLDLSTFNCLLLVKDFNDTGFEVDSTFMTNADTPSLALSGVVDDPVNPFTGHVIDASKKDEPVQEVAFSQIWQVDKNNGNVFQPEHWFSVHDDISIGSNWTYLGYY